MVHSKNDLLCSRGEASKMYCAHFSLSCGSPDLLHLANVLDRIHLLNMCGVDTREAERVEPFT